jgi:hypothetical protein
LNFPLQSTMHGGIGRLLIPQHTTKAVGL